MQDAMQQCPFPHAAAPAVPAAAATPVAAQRESASKPPSEIPVYDGDLFAPDALRDPFAHYKAIRDLGPVVRLNSPDCYALARFKNVREALRAPASLICSKGVGFSAAFNANLAPNLLASDGDQHTRMRNEMMRALLPAELAQHRELMRKLIGDRVASLVNRGPFDAVAELARLLPVAVISHLVGIPEEGRASMLDWAAATFNAVGPERTLRDADREKVMEWRNYLGGLSWESIREGSWARAMETAITTGRLSAAEAQGVLSAFVIPSLDTTILTQSVLLYHLASNRDQWQALKSNPSLVRSATIEGVRYSSVVRWFSRVAEQDYPVEGQVIPKGARIMIMYAAANHDERQFPDPERFDIRRDAKIQLAWGSGPHQCAGQHLATLELDLLLEALLEGCESIELAGTPTVSENMGLYGYTALPMELRSGA